MYRGLISALLFSVGVATAQTANPSIEAAQVPTNSPPSSQISPSTEAEKLPDAPSATAAKLTDVVAVGETSLRSSGKPVKHCNAWHSLGMIAYDPNNGEPPPLCSELVYPYQRFLGTNVVIPLTPKQKGYLALHATTDPGTLGTIIGISAISIAADSHSAYGPGLKGFGKLAGVSLLQTATGEFFGTFAIPSLTHQDPRYFRQPQKPLGKRLLYSISRSYVSRSDSGKTIPNYGVLGAYPIVAELSNLYVPGIESDGASTVERIATGLALDPVNNIINEFLPDVAKRIHVRIIFVQQILNNVAATQGGLP